MKKCEKCDNQVEDKYKYCLDCLEKIKQGNKAVDNSEVVKALGAINNNLYYLRRAMAVMLREKLHVAIEWDKKKKDFVEKAWEK